MRYAIILGEILIIIVVVTVIVIVITIAQQRKMQVSLGQYSM